MKNRDKIIGSVSILLIFIIFFGYGFFKSSVKEEKAEESIFVETSSKKNTLSNNINTEENKKVNENLQNKSIKVQIKGEIKSPGVYSLNNGDRVEDLIKLAGGFSAEADVDKVISQAKKLRDEDCIIVPRKGGASNLELGIEVDKSINNTVSTLRNEASDKVNINIATKEELMRIPGIGEVIASNIIGYREKNGGFNSLEELKKIDRIGDKTFEKLKEKLDIN